jgi:glycosyltransferase involved in cell wall biosynthesis
MTRILICGNSLGQFSGLGYEAANILKGFMQSKKFDVRYGILSGGEIKDASCYGQEIADMLADPVNPLKYYNLQVENQQTCKQFDSAYLDFHPEIVLCVHDAWTIEAIINSPYRKNFMLVLYATIETPEYPETLFYPTHYDATKRKSLKHMLQNIDMIIPVTQMGKDALKKLDVKAEDFIYNGIDFNNHCKTITTKSIVFHGDVANDDFLFMAVGENNIRKRMDLVLEAFAGFLNKVEHPEKYKLYLHCNMDTAYEGTDLREMIKVLNIGDQIIMITSAFVPQDILYQRYSVADCLITLSGGEGFNLPVAEAMAHRKPVIYCDYGGHVEYLKDIGFPVKVKNYYHPPHGFFKWAMADTDDAIEKMLYVASKPEELKARNHAGFEFAKTLDWSIIFPKIYKTVVDRFNDFELPAVELKRMY